MCQKEIISLSLLLMLWMALTDAVCPPPNTVTQSARVGSLFGPRALNNECCVKTNIWNTCQCNWGLQCCPNSVGSRICIDDPCRRLRCGTNGRCQFDSAGAAECVCDNGFAAVRNRCVTNASARRLPKNKRNNNAISKPRANTGGANRNNNARNNGGLTSGLFGSSPVSNWLRGVLCTNKVCGQGSCVVSGGLAVCQCFQGATLDAFSGICIISTSGMIENADLMSDEDGMQSNFTLLLANETLTSHTSAMNYSHDPLRSRGLVEAPAVFTGDDLEEVVPILSNVELFELESNDGNYSETSLSQIVIHEPLSDNLQAAQIVTESPSFVSSIRHHGAESDVKASTGLPDTTNINAPAPTEISMLTDTVTVFPTDLPPNTDELDTQINSLNFAAGEIETLIDQLLDLGDQPLASTSIRSVTAETPAELPRSSRTSSSIASTVTDSVSTSYKSTDVVNMTEPSVTTADPVSNSTRVAVPDSLSEPTLLTSTPDSVITGTISGSQPINQATTAPTKSTVSSTVSQTTTINSPLTLTQLSTLRKVTPTPETRLSVPEQLHTTVVQGVTEPSTSTPSDVILTIKNFSELNTTGNMSSVDELSLMETGNTTTKVRSEQHLEIDTATRSLVMAFTSTTGGDLSSNKAVNLSTTSTLMLVNDSSLEPKMPIINNNGSSLESGPVSSDDLNYDADALNNSADALNNGAKSNIVFPSTNQSSATNASFAGGAGDPCNPNPCEEGALCVVSSSNDTTCQCPQGKVLSANGCVDSACLGNPCGAGGTCRSGAGGNRVCTCRSGFIINSAQNTCMANPCRPGANPCGPKSNCKITRSGSAGCFCKPGFIKHNRECIDDPCLPNPCGNRGGCTRSGSTFSCTCSVGNILQNGVCIVDPATITTTTTATTTTTTTTTVPTTTTTVAAVTVPTTAAAPVVSTTTTVAAPPATTTTAAEQTTHSASSGRPVSSQSICGSSACPTGALCLIERGKPVCTCKADTYLQPNGQCLKTHPGPASPRAARTCHEKPCAPGTCRWAGNRVNCDCPLGFHSVDNKCVLTHPCASNFTTPSTLDLRKQSDPSRQIATGDTTGCMRSRNYPLAPYYPDLFDEVELMNLNGHTKLHIIFEHLETQAKTKDPYLSVNHCAADMIHIKGNLFCGYIGEEHKPTSWVLDVTGMKKIMMGFVSDDENDFKGFLLRWILE